jgi:ligand-binding sensor domain-containing protein
LVFQDVHSQTYQFSELINSADGLSQSTVNCIVQDEDGFLWIGTQDGLNQYDGYNFTYYFNQPGDSTSLSDNYITSLCLAPDGSIWAGTMSGGLNHLDKKTGRFSRYQNLNKKGNSISDNTIWTIAADKDGNIYAGTTRGLNIVSPDGNIKSFTPENSEISSHMITSLFVDDKDLVWIGTNKGLASYHKSSGSFSTIEIKATGVDLSNNTIWSINKDDNQHIICGSNKGLLQTINNTTALLLPGTEELSTIWSLFPIAKNKIWCGTRNGLICFDKKTRVKKPVVIDANVNENTITNTWSILKDHSGLLWAGSDEGLLKFEPTQNTFKILNEDKNEKIFLSGQSVNSILVDSENTLWIGTDGQGLNQLKSRLQQFEVLNHSKINLNSIPGDRIWALLEDSEGIIWIGTYGNGLCSYDKKQNSFKRYPSGNKKNQVSNTRILALYEDLNGNIWIGTRGGGISLLNKKTDEIQVFKNNPNDPSSLPSNTILSIAGDKSGNIWIGNYKGGLSRFDQVEKSFINYQHSEDHPSSISNDNVWCILADHQNRLWLGTQGGLNCVDLNDPEMKFHHLTTDEGLPGNTVFGLEHDMHGNIWMSTFRGIAQLNISRIKELTVCWEKQEEFNPDPFHPIIESFSVHDGIHGNEFNQGAYFKDQKGFIYFGGLLGMTYFHPDSLKKSNYDPTIKLTGFKVFNKDVQINPELINDSQKISKNGNTYLIPQKISYLENLDLSYRESVFSFSFASLDLTNPDQNHYAYIMEGFEENWNYVKNQTQATYTNLDPGEYTFRVKGSNADGVWSPKEAKLNIYIKPPFWQTNWFYVVSGLTFLLILFFTIRQILISQKRKAQAEKEKIELQLKTIKNQIDPHFAFNAINMIGSLVYKNDPDTVYDYFSKFAKLIRSTLQDSAKIARPLMDEIEFVKSYIEIQKTRFKEKFDYEIKLDEAIDLNIHVPKMIIQTYSENAIKHGLMHKKSKGNLIIDIAQQNSQIKITVTDDGIGRKQASLLSKSSTGKGMMIVSQIFGMYNKLNKHQISQEIIDLYDKNHKPAGTQVILTIDIKN